MPEEPLLPLEPLEPVAPLVPLEPLDPPAAPLSPLRWQAVKPSIKALIASIDTNFLLNWFISRSFIKLIFA